ncbi:YncE family protein [Actinomadura sp. SCN-SB]|uniref:YncE family protein n=1 Tax=Actinomadura sp. SCN-SB TaxID=3373092 RepID=UPI003752578C
MVAVALLAVSGCESPVPFYRPGEGSPHAPRIALGGPAPYAPPHPTSPAPAPVPQRPRGNVYAAAGPGMLAPTARGLPPRVYVPNAATGTVDVIDQQTGRLAGRIRVGGTPDLIVPSGDLRRLWVTDLDGGVFRPVAPSPARRGEPLRISRPGVLYFSPDGRTAIVPAARPGRVDFRHPRSMEPLGTLRLPCTSAYRAGFSADGSSLVTTCPASRKLVRVDLARRAVTAGLKLPRGARPGDLRLSPDGRTFLVADPAKGGLWTVDAARLRATGFVRTGPGAHGLVFDRSHRRLFVIGRDGTVSAYDLAGGTVSRLFRSPGGRPLLAGGVSPDGGALWLSDPLNGTVYALSTQTGRPFRKVRVGGHPGSPCVHPQPGRVSLGGTGLYR